MATSFKPIPTVYKNIPFRSRLEARWAVCFDTLDIEWRYELEGFEGNGRRYLPDFYLPLFYHDGTAAWVEVKGKPPDLDEFIKATLLAKSHRDTTVIITWEYFSDDTASDNVVLWHDDNGVFHSERGLDWLPNHRQGWRAARLARFEYGQNGPVYIGDTFVEMEGPLPF